MGVVTESTNALYGASGALAAFAQAHPGERVLASSATKAMKTDRSQPVERGVGWVVSRRGTLVVSTDRVACGDWDIPIAQITRAELLSFRTLLSGGLLLRLETTGGAHYQFGLRKDPVWDTALPFPVTRGTTRLASSPASIAVRVVAVLGILWAIARMLGWL